jgi:DNA modification methylase
MTVRIINADVFEGLAQLDDESVQCVLTSPPYWGLRDYGVEGQIGLEPTPEAFVEKMVAVFREVKRVLRNDGTLWLNLGDSYNNRTKVRGTSHQPALNGFTDDNWAERAARGGVRMSNMPGIKEKDLVGIPWMVAFALRADGWYLRQEIIWNKPNPMPESVGDRCTKAHEHIFLLTKSARYHYDAEAIKEPLSPGTAQRYESGFAGNKRSKRNSKDDLASWAGKYDKFDVPEARNKRSVWSIATQPYSEAHFATFPPELPETCIKAGSKPGDMILDPFGGAGTTGLVADQLGRDCILIELNPDYAAMAERRIQSSAPLFAQVETTAPEKQLDLEESLSNVR